MYTLNLHAAEPYCLALFDAQRRAKEESVSVRTCFLPFTVFACIFVPPSSLPSPPSPPFLPILLSLPPSFLFILPQAERSRVEKLHLPRIRQLEATARVQEDAHSMGPGIVNRQTKRERERERVCVKKDASRLSLRLTVVDRETKRERERETMCLSAGRRERERESCCFLLSLPSPCLSSLADVFSRCNYRAHPLPHEQQEEMRTNAPLRYL